MSNSALLSGNGHESPAEEDSTEKPSWRKTRVLATWTARVGFQIFCLAWLAPILFIIIKNFQDWVIGASAWCPGHDCSAELFNPDYTQSFKRATELDLRSHDLLGSLQFAAKALEVWFSVIAMSFVYLYTMTLAGKGDGMPLGYLTWPNEFTDLTSLLDLTLWTTPFSKRAGSRGLARSLQLFVIVTVFVCIICNLMGPSVAVLVIPALQWLPTKSYGDFVFQQMTSNLPPDAHSLELALENQDKYIFAPCSSADFNAQDYSCTTSTIGQALDTLVDEYLGAYDSGSSDYGLIQQGLLSSIVYNFTHNKRKPDINRFYWTPSRQVLQHLNEDYKIVEKMSLNKISKSKVQEKYESYEIYNRSLQLKLQRGGPMLGAKPNIWLPDDSFETRPAWTTQIDSNRSIRCFQQYWFPEPLDADYHDWTRCIRLGTGWSETNKQVNFSISGSRQPLSGVQLPGLNLTITYSDRAAFFAKNQPPHWLPKACLSNFSAGNISSNASCDWDRFFSTEIPGHRQRSTHTNTWEIYIANNQSSPALAFDFTAYLNFSIYQLDPSPLTNPLLLVQTLNVPTNGTPLVIDPSWALLAMSANAYGDIPANRTATLQMIDQGDSIAFNGLTLNAIYTIQLAILHMLTLLKFTAIPKSATVVPDSEHPLLQRNGTVFVYAYSLSSRTSKLGVVVAIAGILVVLANAFMSLKFYRPRKSITQIVAAALEHPPNGEFYDAQKESDVVKTRFKVDHVDDGAGQLKFRRRS